MEESAVDAKERFKRYVGFISPPGAFDYSAQQFWSMCADPVGVIQHMAHYAGAEYGPEIGDVERRIGHLRDGVAGLREARVDIVAQCGGYWSLPYAPDISTARGIEADLSKAFGVRVILNWVGIADALASLGARRIAVAAGCYRPRWTAASVDFLESAGFELLWVGDIIDQGIVPDHDAKLVIEVATRWDYPDDIVRQACIDAARRAPDCDAVLQIGAGMRTSFIVQSVEDVIGKPLVATDISIFWAVMKAGGLRARPGHGRLLASASSTETS